MMTPVEQRATIRVVVVDDHELLRGGIRFALLAVDDIELVGEARHGAEALSVCTAAQPDVVLMDMHLPGEMDGVAATRAIRTVYPTVQVLVLSSFANPDQVYAVLQAGAIGYLVKGVSVKVMTDAIRAGATCRHANATTGCRPVCARTGGTGLVDRRQIERSDCRESRRERGRRQVPCRQHPL